MGSSPRAAPHPSLHVFLAVTLWPQNFAMRELKCAKALCALSSLGKLDPGVVHTISTIALGLWSCWGKSVGSGQVWKDEKDGLLELGKVC